MTRENLINRLASKYSIEYEDASDTVEFAIAEYRRLSNDTATSEEYSDDIWTWIKKACYEIIDRNRMGICGGVLSVSENGYSVSADGNILSQSLQSEIVPYVDCPR